MQDAVVARVHRDDIELYYTVRFMDGTERQTERSKLRASGLSECELLDRAATAGGDGSNPLFEAAASFEGGRPGAVFKLGAEGLGYYRDMCCGDTTAQSTECTGDAAMHSLRRPVHHMNLADSPSPIAKRELAVAAIAQRLRPRAVLPLSMEDRLHDGVHLPRKHCAFLGCGWEGLDNQWLEEHLESCHADEFAELDAAWRWRTPATINARCAENTAISSAAPRVLPAIISGAWASRVRMLLGAIGAVHFQAVHLRHSI